MDTGLSIQRENRADGAVVVTLRGQGDFHAAQQLDAQLTQLSASRPGAVVFDLRGLTFISSLFMGSLVRFRHACARRCGQVRIAGASEMVRSALHRARLDAVLPVRADVEAALADIAAAQPAVSAQSDDPATASEASNAV
jgi:anti-anti-sigma factor